MSQSFMIRPELPSDVPAIADITMAAFRFHPHSRQTERYILAGLRRSAALSLSLVAEAGGQVVGHVAFSTVTIADGSEDWYGLGPISVTPSLQGRGIGQALVHSGLTVLRDRGAHGCVVLGPPKYYERFGFAANPDLTFSGAPPELFMSLTFTPPQPRGEVTYHDAFNACA